MSPTTGSVVDGLKIVVVGGVAGGASAAARARRVNATAQITILEKGPYVSFANCGLPYHLGGEIAQRSKLLVSTAELFWKRFRIAVQTGHEVTRIDRDAKIVHGIDHASGQSFQLPYDRLILSTGSQPITPAFMTPPSSNVYHLWTLPDLDAVMAQLGLATDTQVTATPAAVNPARRAVVVGGGFVGLEVVEQLAHRSLAVTLIERNPQVLKPLDWDMARLIELELIKHGVQLRLSTDITGLRRDGDRATAVELADGDAIDTDLVIVGAGVRPRTELATAAGFTTGRTAGVEVNAFTQTVDADVYAVGDMIEYQHGVFGQPQRVPLAGPANRAGRVAGAHAATGRSEPLGPVLGTSIVRVFDLTAGCTGANTVALDARGIAHQSVIIQATNHAGYYPGAQSMVLKLIYAPGDGKILGAQAVGGEGVDKRIDVIATAIHFGATVYQLAELDLAYAPPFGSAKDPVHMAAFVAINDLNQWPAVIPPDSDLTGLQVLDVRTAKERAERPLAGAIAIEVDELSDRWIELDPQRPTVTVCHSGKRSHVAACLLKGHGFADVRNLTGGMSMRSILINSALKTDRATADYRPAAVD